MRHSSPPSAGPKVPVGSRKQEEFEMHCSHITAVIYPASIGTQAARYHVLRHTQHDRNAAVDQAHGHVQSPAISHAAARRAKACGDLQRLRRDTLNPQVKAHRIKAHPSRSAGSAWSPSCWRRCRPGRAGRRARRQPVSSCPGRTWCSSWRWRPSTPSRRRTRRTAAAAPAGWATLQRASGAPSDPHFD